MASRFDDSIPIAFDWQHKILLLLPEVSDKFRGEVEVDNLWIDSQKGDNNYQVKILSSQTKMKIINIGRIKLSSTIG